MILGSPKVQAQTFQEWWNQKATQKKYLLQQIAALQVYIGYLEKGYQVVNSGLNTVKDIMNGEFHLHDAYISSLKQVNPVVRNDKRVDEILAMQEYISEAFAKISNNGSLSVDQNSYVASVKAQVLTECSSDIDELVLVITAGKVETAGALGNAEVIFITAKLPEYIRVGRNDLIEQYLMLTSSHDGSGSINIAFTPIRICCNNTLNAALKNNSGILKIRHTASATDKLKQAHKLLGITNMLSIEMEAIYNRWARVRITDPELKRLIQMAMVPNKEVLQKLRTGQEDELSTTYNLSMVEIQRSISLRSYCLVSSPLRFSSYTKLSGNRSFARHSTAVKAIVIAD
ncbi:DUF932 domain-containing protein [Mucilaginibacter gracilis]|uniref:DUF932 domain-containing protein n=1 Tax=Mucilaginibacter gracilis TaxID=423350 RepID=UPI001FE36F1F|nr:DUF932 domain-containing protein [Mucilaginibacter gracilis]